MVWSCNPSIVVHLGIINPLLCFYQWIETDYTCGMYKCDLLMQNLSRCCCFNFLWEFIRCVGILYNMCWIIFIFCYEIYFLFLLFFYLKWNKIIKLYFGNYNLLTCRGPHHPLVLLCRKLWSIVQNVSRCCFYTWVFVRLLICFFFNTIFSQHLFL